MHTRKQGLVDWYRLDISKKNYVIVFIWADRRSIRRALPHAGRFVIGHCLTNWVEHSKTKQHKSGPKFGEMHFIKDRVDAGLAAHEIAHLTNYWIRFQWWILERDDEKIAQFSENVSRAFWREWNQRFVLTP